MMEDFVLDRLVAVLSLSLCGTKLRSARCGDGDELLLDFDDAIFDVALNRQHPHAYLLRAPLSSTAPPDAFAQTVSAALGGQRLVSLAKDRNDRILRLSFSLGTTLVLEFIPVVANAYLLGPAGGVLAQRFGDSIQSRRLRTGAAYSPPEASEKASFEWWLEQDPEAQLPQIDSAAALVKGFQGFGPVLAAELWTRSGGKRSEMKRELQQLRNQMQSNGNWYAYFPQGFDRKDFRGFNFWRDCLVSPARLLSRSADQEVRFQDFTSLSEDLRVLESRWKKYEGLRRGHLREFEQAVRKKQQLRENLERQLRESEEADSLRRYGELLKMHSHLHQTKNLPEKIEVPDLFDPSQNPVEIALPCRDSFQDNIEHYFRSAKRLERSRVPLQQRLSKAAREVQSAEEQLSKFNQARDAEELEFIPRKPAPRGSRPGEKASPFRKYTSSDGITIMVGRSNRENDELTFSEARSRDLWLHAADYPGSHVVVKLENRSEVPPRTLREAAQLAAFYSKAKDLKKAAVHYTQRKYVSKIKGAAPGKVRLAEFKTIIVEPARQVGETS